MRPLSLLIVLILAAAIHAQPKGANPLAYLDELDLYYPSHAFPKLITPQWVGEKDVDAVVILAIDDMKDSKKYETYLRPILDRLKKIDGRAPVSIMACSVDPMDPQLQSWLKEGLSIECHTFDHPCPFFKNGFKRGKETYEKCVDLMNEIPGNRPVAFRMPCCDSMNTPSPRFLAEIFNNTSEKKKFLAIDSSVFMAYTSRDPELPKDLVLDKDGKERFLEYFPKDRTFVNWIENYPYPYMIGGQCWQFPCMTPSDWQANHRHKPFNPQTVADWKAALDCTVVKKGVFTMVFHPHGWIKADQVVDLIDHAVEKYGPRVKFLTFREALALLEKNLLERLTLRDPELGDATGILLMDVNRDGYLDVLNGHPGGKTLRLWHPPSMSWKKSEFVNLAQEVKDKEGRKIRLAPNFDALGAFRPDGNLSIMQKALGGVVAVSWSGHFNGNEWQREPDLLNGIDLLSELVDDFNFQKGGVLLRDIDGDGVGELILSHPKRQKVYSWREKERKWNPLPFRVPDPASIVDERGNDNGLQLADLNGDGKLDLLFSNEDAFGIYLFTDMKTGWSKKIAAGKRGDKDELPMISKNGTNNGFFLHSGHLWWSNEDTALLRDFVDRRKIADLLKGITTPPSE